MSIFLLSINDGNKLVLMIYENIITQLDPLCDNKTTILIGELTTWIKNNFKSI